MKIGIITLEYTPLVKVGVMADLVSDYSFSLAKKEEQVCIFLPAFRGAIENFHKLGIHKTKKVSFSVQVDHEEKEGKIFLYENDNMKWVLIQQDSYFDRESVYLDTVDKIEFADTLDRFIFFAKSVLYAITLFDWKLDILHAHDWETGLCHLYVALEKEKQNPLFENLKTVFSIHRLYYQGIFGSEKFSKFQIDNKYFHPDYFKFYDQINCLQAVTVFSDQVITLSPSYAKEIQEEQYGFGIENAFQAKAKKHRLVGILDAIGENLWDPTSKYASTGAFTKFSNKFLKEKEVQKQLFLEKFYKDIDPKTPFLAIVSKIKDQKGWDLLFFVMDELLQKDICIVVLGQGKALYEQKLLAYQKKYPQKIKVFLKFSSVLAKTIFMSSDISLIPALYGPASLTHQYSKCYGCIPLGRNIGGLKDNITDKKDGFVFEEYHRKDFLAKLDEALEIYKNDFPTWEKIIQNAMKNQRNWDEVVDEYIKVYQNLFKE